MPILPNPNGSTAKGSSDWNARYRFVRELLPLLPLGPALDLACGSGRHSLLLASRQQPVTAVDSSDVALELLEQHARAAHCEVTHVKRMAQVPTRRQGIQLWHADLEEVSLPSEAFSLVLCVNYLQRSLFPQIENALVPGGMLLFETYTVAQLEFAGGPRNTNYLLESGELRTAFPKLRNLFYRELRAEKGIASLIAQKPSD